MTFMLSQKSAACLQEAKSLEQLCVDKYNQAAQNAHCPQLSQLFSNIATQEQKHLEMVTALSNQQIPAFTPQVSAMAGISAQNGEPSRFATSQSVMQNSFSPVSGQYNQQDKALLEDLLKDEKYISNTYDQSIFEQTDGQARNLLNTIQQQEQEHGKMLFDYMNSHGMYAIQPATS